jgi:pimeloyl-ACP methyl ester carboxylesterase
MLPSIAAMLAGARAIAVWPPADFERLAIGGLGFLAGLATCILLAIVEYGAWVLVVPPRVRESDAGEREFDGVPERITVLASDGILLSARWHPATGETPTGRTALLIHGFAEASREIQAVRVAALNAGGWNVAAIDLRGYGESGGHFASFGGREAGDVVRWLDEIAGRVAREAPGEPFVPILWGRSMGAAVAIRAAAGDHLVRALVLESPMVDLDDAMRVWFRSRKFPASRVLARLVTRRAGRIAGVSLTRPRPLELASRVACPTLVVHGEADRLVSVAEARRLASAIPGGARRLDVPEAGHTDVLTIGGEPLVEQILAFLDAAAVGRGRTSG